MYKALYVDGAPLDFKMHLAVGMTSMIAPHYASLGCVGSRYVSRLCDLASRFVSRYWIMSTNCIFYIDLCGSFSPSRNCPMVVLHKRCFETQSHYFRMLTVA